AAGCRCDQGVMHIGEVNARLWKESIAIAGNILPIRLQTRFAGKREAPEQRSTVGKYVQWRIVELRRPDVLPVDFNRAFQVAGFEQRQSEVPGEVPLQETGLF